MNRISIPRIALVLAAALVLSSVCAAEVLKIVVNDTIQPITEEYIARAIDEAARRNDQAVLIEINTPGGLVESTRRIIEKITNSKVPVILYVAPSGRRRSHGSRNQCRRGASRAALRPNLGKIRRRDEAEDRERCRRADAFGSFTARPQRRGRRKRG